MAFQRQQRQNKFADGRLTGLFKSKKQGLWVGTARPEDVERLISKIKEAVKAKRGLTFFLWKNDSEGGGPVFSLNCDVAQEFKARRPIQPAVKLTKDSFLDDEPEDDIIEDEDPFK